MSNINLTVNGSKYSLPGLPGETLSDLLRNRLRLTGTKIGCNEAECGACTVLVEGQPILSCIFPAERADGKTIVTIEGLAERVHAEMKLHPLQEAFVEHGAVQCGFCIPGQIMTAYALLKRCPDPSQEDIRVALKDTLCRCAGYPTIENSILAAARSLRVPTMLVRGGISDVVSDETTKEFLDAVSHAKYVDVAGAGHMVAGDRIDVFSKAVIEFLAEVQPLL